MQNQLSINNLDRWALLPSPKMLPTDRVGVYSWDKFYSAFSERFAIEALRLLGPHSNSLLLEPFLGSGTAAVAAARLGMNSVAVELDPFSALIARARLAVEADPDRVHRYLRIARGTHQDDAEPIRSELFGARDLRYAQSFFSGLEDSMESMATELWRKILGDGTGKYDSEVVAIAAITLGARVVGRVVGGSNPVWFRRAQQGEVDKRPTLATAATQIAKQLVKDLRRLSHEVAGRFLALYNGRIEDQGPIGCQPDIVLTSPPYLNRLDYVVSHLAPLEFLSCFLPIDIESMRREMLGTTKIVEKQEAESRWGPECEIVLQKIRDHTSKASATYYYWIYCQYFRSLFAALARVQDLASPDFRGALVVQNSYYKELPVALPQIVVEMLSSLDMRGEIAKREVVRSHLGTMSPTQTKHLKKKVLEEGVVRFSNC